MNFDLQILSYLSRFYSLLLFLVSCPDNFNISRSLDLDDAPSFVLFGFCIFTNTLIFIQISGITWILPKSIFVKIIAGINCI